MHHEGKVCTTHRDESVKQKYLSSNTLHILTFKQWVHSGNSFEEALSFVIVIGKSGGVCWNPKHPVL